MDRDGLVVDLPGLVATRVGLLGPPPGGERRGRGCRARRPRRRRDRGRPAGRADARATRLPAGRDAWSCVTLPGAGPGGADAEVLLDGAHNPAGAAASRRRSTSCGPLLRGGGGDRRGAAGGALDRWSLGDHGRQGRRGRPRRPGGRSLARRGAGHRHAGRRAAGPAGGRPRGALGGGRRGASGPSPSIPEPAAAVAEAARRAPRGRSWSPGRSTWSAPRGRSSSTTRTSATRRRIAPMSEPRPADGASPTDPRIAARPRPPAERGVVAPDPGRGGGAATPSFALPPDAGRCRPARDAGAARDRPADLRLGTRTFVVGILNVTPDSFSGDGLLAGRTATSAGDAAVAAALALARRMVDEGADLLDVGGESSRPGHAAVDAAEETRPRRPGDPGAPRGAARRAALDRHDEAVRGGCRAGRRRAPPQRRLGRRRGRRPRAGRGGARRPARPHAQPGRGPLHGPHGRDRGRPPAGARAGRRGRACPGSA